MNLETLLTAVGIIVALLVTIALVVVAVRGRRTANRRLKRARAQVLANVEDFRRTNHERIRNWSSAMYWSQTERTSVRELGDYGASGAAWTALENGGVRTVETAARHVSQLTEIQGVGPNTAGGVAEALTRHAREAPVNLSALRHSPAYAQGFQTMTRLDRLARAIAVIEKLDQETDALIGQASGVLPLALGLAKEEPEIIARAARLIEHWDRVHTLVIEIELSDLTLDAGEAELLNRYHQLFRHRLLLTLDSERSAAREGSERWFEDNVIEPWLRELRVRFERQYPVEAQFGSKARTGFVDFLLQDPNGAVAVLESKRTVGTKAKLEEARAQAQSYAYSLKLHRYAVAAPEGLWVYEWSVGGYEQLLEVRIDELGSRGHVALELLGIRL